MLPHARCSRGARRDQRAPCERPACSRTRGELANRPAFKRKAKPRNRRGLPLVTGKTARGKVTGQTARFKATEPRPREQNPMTGVDRQPRGKGPHRGNRAPGGIRTPNLLIRSQMLYPLSYGRLETSTKRSTPGTIPADHHRRTTRPTTLSAAVSPGTSPQVTGQLYGQLRRLHALSKLRRRQDLNLRSPKGQLLSREPHSAALARLRTSYRSTVSRYHNLDRL